MFIISCGDSSVDNKGLVSEDTPNIPSFEKYKKEAVKVDFRKAALGKYEVNSLFELNGEVRKWEEGYLLVSLNKSGYIYSDFIFVKFEIRPEVLIDDKVKIFARFEKIGGSNNQTPIFIADFYSGPEGAGNFPKNTEKKSKDSNNQNNNLAEKSQSIDALTLVLEYSSNPFDFRKKRLGKTFETSFRYIGFNDYSGRARIFDEGGFYCFMNPNKFSSLNLTRGDQIIIKGVLNEDSSSIGFNNCQFVKRDDS